MKILVSPGKRFPTFLGPYEAALMGRLPCVSRLSPVCLPLSPVGAVVSTCVRRICTALLLLLGVFGLTPPGGCEAYLLTPESLSGANFYLEFRLKIALRKAQCEVCVRCELLPRVSSQNSTSGGTV